MSDAVYEGPDFHPEAPKNTRAAGQGAAASGFSGAPRCHAAGEGQKPAGAAAEAPQNENGGFPCLSDMTTGEAEAFRNGFNLALLVIGTELTARLTEASGFTEEEAALERFAEWLAELAPPA